MDIILDKAINKMMTDEYEQQYKKLMTSVLRKVRASEEGHLFFNTTRHKIHAVICKEFENDKLPLEGAMNNHTRNLNLFIDLKCNGNQDMANKFMGHIAKTQRWKNSIYSSLKLSVRLSTKETMIQYMRFCRNNAMQHRIFGYKTAQEQLSTEVYGVCSMEVSEEYAKKNKGRKLVDVNTFHLNPFEQICCTFEKIINKG